MQNDDIELNLKCINCCTCEFSTSAPDEVHIVSGQPSSPKG